MVRCSFTFGYSCMGKKVEVQPVKIGVDTTVQVRLTEFGWSLYEDYLSTHKRPKTVNGYLTMPLATLMNIFGTQLSTLPYDERFSVFVDNEIIYNMPNLLVSRLAEQVESAYHANQQKNLEKWAKRMRSFKAGDKVSTTVGGNTDVVCTYVGLIHHLGSEAHEIKCENGRTCIIDFFELDYANQP